jgi:signal transduction histidine kinase
VERRLVTEKVNILLVDDQPAKLLGYEAILEQLGETLIKAGSAAEALEQLLKRNIAVILIDVCMPELDGFQLATMIRDHPRFRSTAIIFVSAIQVTDLDRLRGYELGAVDYVPVPVIPELLRAKVKVFAELYRKTRQLERLNAELESRVAERTAELAQANADLERRVEERTREREAALAQVHEMQKLESLGKLTGGVAHDFNNLLMAVLGNLELVKKRVPDDAVTQRLIDGAIKGAERGAALTKRMLAFARRQELRPEVVDIPKLVDGLSEMLGRSAGPTIQITTDFQSDLAPICVDPNQLELALLNLAVNGRDAMPDGGQLMISARAERVGMGDLAGLNPGEYVRIEVRDTGSGMDETTLRRATEPFFTTKDLGRGTGFGLSMVDGFVAQSGGAMRITSQLGRGTSVEIWLPVSYGNQDALPLKAIDSKRPIRHRLARVLVVDDDPIVGASTVAMLEDLGHTAVQVASGADAIAALDAEAGIDIVISDYAMPGMTGKALAEIIHRKWPGMPVVIATGYSEEPEEQLYLPRLGKPYRQDELATLIETTIENPAQDTPRAAAQ